MKKIFCFILIIFLPIISYSSDSDINIIEKIEFEGLKKIKKDQLKDIISVKPGMLYQESVLLKLKEDVRKLYQSGYFSGVSVDLKRADKGLLISYIFQEQPIIKKINIAGNKKYPNEEMKNMLLLKEGDRYSAYNEKQSIWRLLNFYKNKGFHFSSVKSTRELSDNKEYIDLSFLITEGNEVTVQKINIQNITVFTAEQIKSIMKTRESAVWNKSYFNEEELNKDMARIKDLYVREGYTKVNVKLLPVEFDKSQSKVTINILVEEGKLYKIRNLDFILKEEGHFKLETLQQQIKLEKNKPFNYEQFNEDIRNIQKFYEQNAYVHVAISPSVSFDDNNGSVDITINIDERNITYVEKIIIKGLTKTKESVVRRALEVKVNDLFSREKINNSMENIYNLGFFEEVTSETEIGTKSGWENLVFIVKEKNTGQLRYGGEYSTLDGITGHIEISENNLWGNGQRISALAEAGLIKRDFELSFLEPRFFGLSSSLQIKLFYILQGYFSDYKDLRYGGEIQSGHPLDKFINLIFRYRYEVIDVYDLKDSADEFIKRSSGRRTKGSLTTELDIDTRDRIVFNTTSGYKLDTFFEVAGLGGELDYLKYVFDWRVFFKTFFDCILAMHFNTGYINGFGSTSDVPFYEKFFLGGTDTVRGYDERILGPSDSGGFYIGGRFSWFTNIEYRIPVFPNFMLLVMFFDAGGLWEDVKYAKSDEIAASAGGGVRINIPKTYLVVRLEYGYGFHPRWFTPKGKVHFTFGWLF